MPIEAASHQRHILHVFRHYELFSKGGGVERYIHHVASKTAAVGHHVRVIGQISDPEPAHSPYRMQRGGWCGLWRAIGMADTIHIHGPRSLYSGIAGIFALLRGRRLFYTVHCFYRGKTRAQALRKYVWDATIERLLFRYARAVIVLSTYWREHLATLNLTPRRCAILPNGVEVMALINETCMPITLAGNPAILSVSRLDTVKRIEDAIRALRQPGLENAHLHIVGCGPDAERLIAITQAEQLTARVTFHQFKTDSEVAAMTRAAHLFVIPSAEEGMPTTILEMLARNLPVVASDIPGNRSILKPLHYPMMYPLGNVEALAACVHTALATPFPTDMQQQLLALFDWDAIVSSMLYQYESA